MLSRLLFWDFDHTLARRRGGFSAAIQTVLAREEPSLVVGRDEISIHLQQGFPWHTPERPHPELGNSSVWWAALEPVFVQAIAAQGIVASRAQELSSLVREVYLSPEYWQLYEDALEILQDLQSNGWNQVLFSNHVPELPQLVRQLALEGLLDGVICSAEIGYEKPHPQSYTIAYQRFGPARRVCMVGDSMRCDVGPPLGLGWQAILVHWQERAAAPDKRAPQACRDLRQVGNLLLS